MKKSRKEKGLILFTLFTLLFVVVGATYAYFVAQKGSGGSAQIEVGAGTTDLLSFTNDDKINIVANQDNFKKGGESIVDKSTVTATLTPNNTTNIAHDTYNVYLIIENNDFEYTTSELKPELMLKVINPIGEEITEMKGFNYTLNQGFDITNKKRAAYPLVKGYEIDANGEAKVDEWHIEVTLVNLESDQNSNAGKTFTGSILITSKDVETYDLAEIKNMISTTTYKSVNASLELDEGTNTIDKYYYAITETEEEPIALSISEVADALSYSYHESEEATYEFTTTDDGEKLKPNQNYKIFSYAKDKEGYQSNIYETIVITDNYEIPVINDVAYSVMPTSITLNVSATTKSAKIIKYQYKLNSEEEWHDFTETTYTINELDEATVYEIKVRAIDEEEMPSNPWEKSITTGKYGSEEFPYEIKTVEDLVKLSNDVNSGKTFANEYFKLMNDIDFNNSLNYQDATTQKYLDYNKDGNQDDLKTELTTKFGFKPIGFGGKYFSGVFDGNNKKINNLHISYNVENSYLALFGWVKDGVVKNLTVGGEVTTEVATPLGGIVNRLENSTIENCINEVNVTNPFSNYAVGGVVGWSSGTDDSISTIKGCSNKGLISNGYTTGGIISLHQKGKLIIENCNNEGKIINNMGNVIGGMIAENYGNLDINNCVNKGVLSTNLITEHIVLLGGIIGANAENVTINSSSNLADFENERTEYTQYTGVHMGGILASNRGKQSIITNSYNTGNFKNSNRMGGIVSTNSTGILIINKCYNSGDLINDLVITNTGGVAGGLIGDISSGDHDQKFILNSYNIGKISNTNQSAGFIGSIAGGDTYIINSYNGGVIGSENSNSTVYGLINYGGSDSIYINNVFNVGNLLSAKKNYGIGFINTTKNTILNGYYKNKNTNGTLIEGSNLTNIFLAQTDEVMKNQTVMSNSKYFYQILNDNLVNINLGKIDSLLETYNLSKFKKGINDYPVFEYQE